MQVLKLQRTLFHTNFAIQDKRHKLLWFFYKSTPIFTKEPYKTVTY